LYFESKPDAVKKHRVEKKKPVVPKEVL